MAGLQSIINLSQRAKKLDADLQGGLLLRDIIMDGEVTAFILDANAQEQLYEQGVNALGVSISDYQPYSPLTIQIKGLKGQPYDRVTLRDEGDFENSFYLNVNDKQFEIKASDFKTEWLIHKYGRQILGLTNENITILITEYLLPELKERTKKILYGN